MAYGSLFFKSDRLLGGPGFLSDALILADFLSFSMPTSGRTISDQAAKGNLLCAAGQGNHSHQPSQGKARAFSLVAVLGMKKYSAYAQDTAWA